MLAAELAKANRRVEDLLTSEKKLKTALADLNAELERPTQDRQQSEMPPPPMDDPVIEAEVARRLEEEMYLVNQRVEGEVVEMTLELQEKVEELQKALDAATSRNMDMEVELARMREAIGGTRARGSSFSTGSPHNSKLPIELMVKQKHAEPSSPEQAVVDQATAERNIAVRVKDEALREAAHIRTELQRKAAQVLELEAEVAKLNNKLQAGGAGAAATHSVVSPPPPTVTALQLQKKDAEINQLKLQLAEATLAAGSSAGNGKQRSADLESLLKDAQLSNAALHANVKALTLELEATRASLAAAAAERDKALAAGKRAFVERQTALKDLESAKQTQVDHEAMILVLQKKMNEQNIDKVRRCFSEAMMNFEMLQERLKCSQSTDETQEILLDVFFEYEHKLMNLSNEVLSLQAIISMKESDLNDDWSRQLCELHSEIEVLRSNLAEQKNTEMELRGVLTALGATERSQGHFHVQAQPLYHGHVHAASPPIATTVAMPVGKPSPAKK